jgi:hypothetical protein
MRRRGLRSAAAGVVPGAVGAAPLLAAGTPRRLAGAAPLLVALAAASLLSACGADESIPRPPAPLSIRGGVVIEPPELAIGETATVEIAVVTPPDHRLEPPPTPENVEGLWVLAAEQAAPEREPGRWVHRARFLVRARATGQVVWPALTAVVETPAGERVELALAERPLRVIEVSREFPGRTTPFSFRAPGEPGRYRGFLLPAALGAGLALAALALAGLVRRARSARREAEGAVAAAASDDPAHEARAALAAAAARVEEDPVAAADAASAALRRYVVRRTRAPADVSTTEEIEALAAPFLLARRWPELLRLLRALDGARFRAGALSGPSGREALRAELRAANALVEDGPAREGAA